MDIHKPKPWHGLREFLREYAIIVIGVLTALGAEQGVEWLHWRHVLTEERATLDAETTNMYRQMLMRVDFQPCVDRRLDDIAKVLKRHDAGHVVALSGPVGRPSYYSPVSTAFNMALADTTFTHMPLEEKQAIFAKKTAYDFYLSAMENEVVVWKTLRSLDRVQSFTPAEWIEVRRAYGLALDWNGVMKTNLHPPEKEGDWLYPFRHLQKPIGASLRHIPWVAELCGPSIVR